MSSSGARVSSKKASASATAAAAASSSGPPPPPPPPTHQDDVAALAAAAAAAPAPATAAPEVNGRKGKKAPKEPVDESKKTSPVFAKILTSKEPITTTFGMHESDFKIFAKICAFQETFKNMRPDQMEADFKKMYEELITNTGISDHAKCLFRAIMGDKEGYDVEDGQVILKLFEAMSEKKGIKSPFQDVVSEGAAGSSSSAASVSLRKITKVLEYFIKVVSTIPHEEMQAELDALCNKYTEETKAEFQEKKAQAIVEEQEGEARLNEMRLALEREMACQEERKRKTQHISEEEEAATSKWSRGNERAFKVCTEDVSLIQEFNESEIAKKGHAINGMLIIREHMSTFCSSA